MKIDIANNPFHLTYCTNIHPGESWKEVFTNLQQFLPPLKSKLSPDHPFGVGLRLADIASRELLTNNQLRIFQDWLKQENLYVFTLNGFPYGSFHRQIVKDKVYAPDWTKTERLDYTSRLIDILAVLLPEDLDGGISTLPLSYKPWWRGNSTGEKNAFEKSSHSLAQLTAKMIQSEQETGKTLHIDLEPEPDGLIENCDEVIRFFQHWLLPIGGEYLTQHLGMTLLEADEKIRRHIRLCYDTCHFAVEYEDPLSVIQRLRNAGISIGKMQLSAAVKVDLPSDINKRQAIADRLTPFAESTYLHQVIERYPDNSLHHYDDLVQALPHLLTTPAAEWRTHFHVPIFIQDYEGLESTQRDISAVLSELQRDPFCRHLEIETYTWDVLPAAIKVDLAASIEREYRWVLGKVGK